jgi:putative aldouronate transport system permease protein
VVKARRGHLPPWSTYVKHRYVYLLVIPSLVYFLVFRIAPIWSLLIAFQDYSPFGGFFGSPWVGFRNFADLFHTSAFGPMFRNTIVINLLRLVFFFPGPIILAIMLSEMRSELARRVSQSIVYLPHFLSWVVVAGLTFSLLSVDIGIVNKARMHFGLEPYSYLSEPRLFWTILVSQNIWRDTGWGTIIFLAAISGIDPSLYEAAVIDGAGRFRQIWHITVASIRNTIVVLLILRLGQMVSVGFEQILLMMNPLVMDVAEVFDTYSYTRGILAGEVSTGVTVGLFKSLINITLVVGANSVVKKMGHEGIL